jgi:hypothetical protein
VQGRRDVQQRKPRRRRSAPSRSSGVRLALAQSQAPSITSSLLTAILAGTMAVFTEGFHGLPHSLPQSGGSHRFLSHSYLAVLLRVIPSLKTEFVMAPYGSVTMYILRYDTVQPEVPQPLTPL